MKSSTVTTGLGLAAAALLALVLPGFVDSWQQVLERAGLLVLGFCY